MDKSQSQLTAGNRSAEIKRQVGVPLVGTVDYAKRAAECRRLAMQYTKLENWAHFTEMAETWEMLLKHQQEKLKQQEELRQQREELKQQEELKQREELKHQQERSRLQTIALADQFRDVLLLSGVRAEKSPSEHNHKNAA